MNDWQQSFLQKLEASRKQWLHKFEDLADNRLEPLFSKFEEFTAGHGFAASAPPCESGTRLFKFGLTENGYVLVTFRMHRLDAVEVCAEIFVPGADGASASSEQVNLVDADDLWVQRHFERALDRFIVAFGEAGTADVRPASAPAMA